MTFHPLPEYSATRERIALEVDAPMEGVAAEDAWKALPAARDGATRGNHFLYSTVELANA